MSGSSGWAQARRYFWPTSSAGLGRGLRIMYRPRSTAAWVHSSMVAAEDSYCTMVLMPRDCHLSKLPLGCDQAPMTKSGGVDVVAADRGVEIFHRVASPGGGTGDLHAVDHVAEVLHGGEVDARGIEV